MINYAELGRNLLAEERGICSSGHKYVWTDLWLRYRRHNNMEKSLTDPAEIVRKRGHYCR